MKNNPATKRGGVSLFTITSHLAADDRQVQVASNITATTCALSSPSERRQFMGLYNMRKARCSTLYPRQRIASRYDWSTALFTSTSRTLEKRSMDGASGDEAGMKHPIYMPVKQKT